ncbi:MAG: GNAT family N-acetyltransferase [Kastovskya adunca ATA6-11-RM4]|jgi:RimJ/RimL family protein N-acetyltransferase|nr:GNAT family N-acetyltransferase [Kastovskya adunca ATA6-11-RM4]
MKPSNLLQGDRVRLDALKRGDLLLMGKWYQQADFLRLLDARPAIPQSETILAAWLEERHRATDGFIFGIRLVETEELLGWVELENILWTHQVAWVSVCIGNSQHRGKGYGYEAMQLILQFAFDELNLYRLQLTVFAYNDRAIALYKKLGFQQEGTYREFLQRDGKRHDMYLYGLLRPEWNPPSAIALSPENS